MPRLLLRLTPLPAELSLLLTLRNRELLELPLRLLLPGRGLQKTAIRRDTGRSGLSALKPLPRSGRSSAARQCHCQPLFDLLDQLQDLAVLPDEHLDALPEVARALRRAVHVTGITLLGSEPPLPILLSGSWALNSLPAGDLLQLNDQPLQPLMDDLVLPGELSQSPGEKLLVVKTGPALAGQSVLHVSALLNAVPLLKLRQHALHVLRIQPEC